MNTFTEDCDVFTDCLEAPYGLATAGCKRTSHSARIACQVSRICKKVQINDFQHISPCKELRERRPAAHFPADVPEIGLEVVSKRLI